MKILLLGATGRTGKLVLQKALQEGHQVNCLARNFKRIPPHNALQVIEGSPLQKADLEKAIEDCTGIISVLNISRTSDFPWSKLRTPDTFLSDVIQNLIPLAEKNNVSRLVVCSAWGVAETNKDLPKWFKWLIDHSNIGVAYKDHERQEEMISRSNLKWTLVRPVGLTNTSKPQEIKVSINNQPTPGLTISRKSLADFLVSSLSEDRLIGQKPVISKK